MKMNLYDFLMLTILLTFLLTAIATFSFSRISVKHIENKMAEEDALPPEWDKGIGARITMYAMVIVAKKVAHVSPVNDQLILRYARPKDWYLAVFYLGSFFCFICISGIAYFLYGP